MNKFYAYKKYCKEIKKINLSSLKDLYFSDYMNEVDNILKNISKEYSLELGELKKLIIFALRRKLK